MWPYHVKSWFFLDELGKIYKEPEKPAKENSDSDIGIERFNKEDIYWVSNSFLA